MTATRTKHIAWNTASGLLSRLVSMLLPFIVRTILIKKLGTDYAGLNSLFTAILQVLSLSELGFSAVICFCMYEPIAKGETAKISALLNLIKKIYRVIGLVILVVGLALTPALPYLIKSSYPSDINLYLLYFIYLFNTVISYLLFAYAGVLLNAHQRNAVENTLTLLTNIIMYGTQIGVLLCWQNYYVYILVMPLCTIMLNLVKYYLVRRFYPEYRAVGQVSAAEKKAIYANIGAMVGHKMSYTVVSSVGNIVISAFLGLALLTIYNNYYYIITALLGVIGIFHNAITATIGNSLIVDDVAKNYRDFKALTLFNVWLVGWMAICLLCLYQPFMRLWLGESFLLPFSSVIWFVLYLYLWRFKDILATYKDAAGMWRADFWKPYVVTVVTLVLNVLLVPLWGLNGTLIAGIIGFFLVAMPWETQVFFRNYFHQKTGPYYLRLALYTAVVVVAAGITYGLCQLLPDGYLPFVGKLAICAVVPNVIFLGCAWWTPELRLIWAKLWSLWRRQ